MRHDYVSRHSHLHAFDADSDFRSDRVLLLVVMILVGFGLVMLTSASISIAEKRMQEPLYFLYRQLIYLGIGLALSAIVLKTKTEQWYRLGYLALLAGLILLVLVLILGEPLNGSKRWLSFGVFNLQVSEMAKLFVLVYLAGYLVRHNEEARTSITGFLKPIVVVLLFCGLILAEPDFGGAFVLLLISMVMMFLAGVRMSMFAAVFAVLFLVFMLFAFVEPYRFDRLMTFLDPWQDPWRNGYQLVNALMAFGMGGVSGAGVGGSVQKLFYLPEPHTDFVLAVIGEELGLVGTAAVLLLFSILVWRAYLIGARAIENGHYFSGYVAYGIATWVALQSFINIGVNLGVVPTKGLTLPLMSYGGTSFIVTLISIAMLLRIDFETRSENEERGSRRRKRA